MSNFFFNDRFKKIPNKSSLLLFDSSSRGECGVAVLVVHSPWSGLTVGAVLSS